MHEELPSTLITWPEVYSLCRQLAAKLRQANFRIDIIIAIARGGYIPGRLLSDMLGIHNLTCFKIEHYQGTCKQHEAFIKYPLNADINGLNVLLLDDVCDSGDTFAVGLEHVRQCGTAGEMRTAALHLKAVSSFIPDFYVDTISEWRWLIYPWAVNEDLSTMIANMHPDNSSPVQLQAQVSKRHGINVSLQQIEDALLLLPKTEQSSP